MLMARHILFRSCLLSETNTKVGSNVVFSRADSDACSTFLYEEHSPVEILRVGAPEILICTCDLSHVQ